MAACKDCIFFRAYKPPAAGVQWGDCRRFPPNRDGEYGQARDTEWCGEFSPSPLIPGRYDDRVGG